MVDRRTDRELRQDMLKHVARKDGVVPNFKDVYTFISSFKYGTTVEDLCQRLSPAKAGNDGRRLVQYLVLKTSAQVPSLNRRLDLSQDSTSGLPASIVRIRYALIL